MPDGTLYVVSTPIGNLEDITLRAIKTLSQSSLIAAEDTRQTKKLLNHLNISIPMISYFDHNKSKQIPKIINELQRGSDVSLVSDAGTPSISDPGFLLIRESIKKNIEIICLPGATALIPALVMSGLPSERFVFEGFLPKQQGMLSRSEALSSDHRSVILNEYTSRVKKTLTDSTQAFVPESEISF